MRFVKMHGAGNDFLIVDNRALSLSEAELMDLALRLALISCAAKTACEELLGVIRDLNPEAVFHQMTVRITEYQINGDWVKTLRSHLRPVYKYKPKKKEP